MNAPRQIRILDWNNFSHNPFKNSALKLTQSCDYPYIACFQELTLKQIKRLRVLPGYTFKLAVDNITHGKTSYLGLLTKGNILRYENRPLNKEQQTSSSLFGRLWNIQECIEYQYALIDLDDTIIQVVNLHLTCAASSLQRRKELLLILKDIDPAFPVIVCGDFNMFGRPWLNPFIGWFLGFEPEELITNEAFELQKICTQYKLTRMHLDKSTYPLWKQKLDCILVRGFTILKSSVEIKMFGSDHRPLVLDIVLNT